MEGEADAVHRDFPWVDLNRMEDWHKDSLSGGNDPKGPSAGSDRVIRGGSWRSHASSCRSADRYGSAPAYRNNYDGFRIVRVLL